MADTSRPFGAIAGVFIRRLVRLFAVVSLFTIHSPLATVVNAADPGIEFGVEDDFTVLGVQGGAADPDVEIKGFTVFGATQAAYTGAAAGPGNVVVNGQLSVSSGAYFAADSTFTVVSVGSITTTGAGVIFSTNVYMMNGNVGIGTTVPASVLHVLGTKNSLSTPNLGGVIISDSNGYAEGVGGVLIFRGKYNSAGAEASAAAIHAAKANDIDGDYGFNLAFLTRKNGISPLQEHMRISNLGNIGIGTAPNAYYKVYIGGASTDTVNNPAALIATNAYGQGLASDSTRTNYGAYFNSATHGTYGNNLAGMVGVSGFATHNGAGTVASVRGLYFGIANAGPGIITAARGIHVPSPSNTGGGSITNNYGIYLDAQTIGTNSNYSIFSVGGTMSHAGSVGIGTTVPSSKFDVLDGSITVRGTNAGLVLEDAGRVISPETDAGLGAGVRVSTNVYIVGFASATKFFGDGSSLTGIAGDNLGDHTATTTLNMSGQSIVNAASGSFTQGVTASSFTAANTAGAGLFVSSSAYLAVSGGSVGIGTTAPGNFLHVYAVSNSLADKLQVGDGTYGLFLGNQTSSGFAPGITAKPSDSNDRFYLLSTIEASDDSGTVPVMTFDSRRTTGAAIATRPLFSFENDGTSVIQIAAAGNVGIGTTAPTHKLHVAGNAIVTSSLSVSGSGLSGTTPVFQVIGDTMTVLANGNIGIGTVSPGAKLEVAGQVKITGGAPGSGKVLTSDAAGLASWAAASGDNLGNHVATTTLQMGAYGVNTSSDITAARYQINGNTMVAILPGINSIAYGVSAGASNITDGDYNVFIGNYAGAANMIGAQNTATGYQALYSNTVGSANTATGYRALYSNTDGVQNTAAGGYALYYNTTGWDNTATGLQALYRNTTGVNNTATGFQALYSNTTGGDNTATGMNTIRSNTTGANNTASGWQALYYNETGSANSVFGVNAGGYGAGGANSFSSSTIMGYQAGYNLTTGSDNTFLGWRAGYNATTGSGNIVIGYDKGTSAPGASSELNIGGVLYGDLSTGKIGVGTASPGARLDIQETNTSNSYSLRVGTSATAYHMVVSTSGSVGIGTVGPEERVHIFGSGAQRIKLESSDTNPAVVKLANSEGSFGMYTDDAGFGVYDYIDGQHRFVIDTDGNVGIGTTAPQGKLHLSRAAVPATFDQANAYLNIGAGEETLNGYHFIAFGYNGSAQTYQPAFIGYTETNNSAYSAGALIFGTRATTTNVTPVERMRIDNTGNVGIGTPGGGQRLHIYDSNAGVRSILQLQMNNSANDGTDKAFIGFAIGNPGDFGAKIGASRTNTFGRSDLLFYTSDTAATGDNSQERVRITNAGNVGIGTTDPGAKLHVSGGNILLDNDRYLYTKNTGGTGQIAFGMNASNVVIVGAGGNSVSIGSGGGTTTIGALSGAVSKLGVYGSAAIGSSYYVSAAPADGMIIQGNVGIGTTVPGAKLEVAGQVKITGGTPGAGKVLTDSDGAGLASWQTPAGMPAGAIVMWSGTIASIPSGWQLCDGTGGTPDLRSRFVRGAPAGVEAGGTGGSDSHTLTAAEMPSHTHPQLLYNDGGLGADGYPTSSGHTVYNWSGYNTGSQGGGGAHNNMPAYYQILFIMKL